MGDDNAKEESSKLAEDIVPGDAPEPKKVVINKSKLKSNFVKPAEKEVPVPQLNKLMGLADGEIAIVKVRQLDLDEYLYCQNLTEDKMRNLMEGIVAAAEKMGEVVDEVLTAYKGLSLKSRYYIDLCLKGTVDPKLSRQDWIFLSKMFPLVVENIAGEIMMLTKGGADLKKNS